MTIQRFTSTLALGYLLVGLAAAQSGDDPPSTPADLDASVYSTTAGAISWSRSTDDHGAVPGYEVTRDDIVLGTFDALSYVDFTLQPGTTYRYGVTAIDNAGQRSAMSTVALRTRDPGDVSPLEGLRMPGELRATVWSATAAGLTWRRAEFGTRYIVRRDGEVLRDGTAFPLGSFGPTFSDFDMQPDRDHVYEIVSVDGEGRRSAPATLTVNTTEAREQRNGPRMPRGLLAEVWSKTAVGLSWERSPEFGTRYIVFRGSDIVRDGTGFESGAFGPTYSDFDLVPGSYIYTVHAIDPQGRRSQPAQVSVTTLSGSGNSGEQIDIVRADNAVELIADTFDTFRGDPWLDIVTALPGFPRLPELPFDETILDCRNGGTATITHIGSTRSVGRGYLFDDCLEESAAFDGDVENFVQDAHQIVSARALMTTHASTLVEYEGHVNFNRDGSALVITEPMFFGHFEIKQPETYLQLDMLFVEELRFQYGYEGAAPVPRIELSGTLEFFSRSNADSLRATTPEPLRRPVDFPLPDLENFLFTEGRLRIESTDDGSFIVLEPSNGDETSARVTVDGAFGGRTSFDVPWSIWREHLRFD